MIEIYELNHVAITVSDLEQSRRFYGEILGLKEIARPAFSFPGAWFALGSQELHLIHDVRMRPEERPHHHFALRVPDAFAARAELEAKGVAEMRGPSPRPDGPMQLFLPDPDGYLIELYSLVEG